MRWEGGREIGAVCGVLLVSKFIHTSSSCVYMREMFGSWLVVGITSICCIAKCLSGQVHEACMEVKYEVFLYHAL